MENIQTTAFIKAKKSHSIKRFHPWVFSGAIAYLEGDPVAGEMIRIAETGGITLGHGLFTPGASIAVRLTHFGEEAPTERWWHERLQNAFDVRLQLNLAGNDSTNCYRLIHGEGDGFPGLIIDHYDGALVIQVHTEGMLHYLDGIAESLKEIYGDNCTSIYNKSEDTLPRSSSLKTTNGFLFGDETDGKIALENGLKFNIDWVNGQKTGFFIDQRENRALLGSLSKGKKVLNTFSYTGGFSVYSLAADATLVHSLDSSGPALELANQNVALNGFEGDKHAVIQADAVQYLKDIEEDYDIIILDPPAFAKHLKARHKAVQGYKRINALAMKQIKPGGLLFTFSCSQAVDKQLFNHTVISAAMEAGRKVRILHQLHQPADHPVNAFHPEGEYLKGLVVRVD
ncbi:MAG: class I SAM-dependent rRNA methyltransferase [Flavobacteriales bacterium]|nr:class I SAM-dependent rRNA methyltransferase [Flavobacteriales bacterium]MDG1780162.1 class I SAM-dependent rRNA methyltransferase [Flavobacteriales bacterium]MDG2247049.1 class I SAM-dependent rRNA methyltransferase [Flavobacteriales bacterium]